MRNFLVLLIFACVAGCSPVAQRSFKVCFAHEGTAEIRTKEDPPVQGFEVVNFYTYTTDAVGRSTFTPDPKAAMGMPAFVVDSSELNPSDHKACHQVVGRII